MYVYSKYNVRTNMCYTANSGWNISIFWNINLYKRTHKIDILYLENYSADNIPLLVDFYNSTNNKSIKKDLKDYLEITDFYEIRGFQEYNISKVRAKESIKKLKY